MSTRAFELIVRRLEADIAEGRLSPGDRLPAERDLSARLGVSRSSIREALRVLETLGVIEIRPGPEHGARLVAHAGRGFAEIVRLQLLLREASVADVVEFRVLVESWAVARAAERGGPAATAIARRAAAMSARTLSREDFFAADADLHVAIIGAAENPILTLVAEGARSALEQALLERARSIQDWPSARDALSAEHLQIASLIVDGRGAQAAEALERHVRGFLTPG